MKAARAATICIIALSHPSHAQPGEAQLSVEGALRIHATQSDRFVMLRIEDETGNPVSSAEVMVQGVAVSVCDGPAQSRAQSGVDGSVCFRLDSPHLERALVLASKAHFAPARQELDLRAQHAPPALLLWPRLVDLDREESHPIELGPIPQGSLKLLLRCDGREREIYEAQAVASDRVRVELGTTAFRGNVGLCDLSGSVGGFATAPVPLTLRASTILRLERIEAGVGDRIEATVEVRTSAGPVENGLVESRTDGELRATASVRAGRAQLEFSNRDMGLLFLVSYLSSSPAITSGPPLAIRLPSPAPSRVSRFWLSLPLLAFAGWLALRWLRSGPGRSKPRRQAQRRPAAPSLAAPVDQHLHGIVFDLDTQERLAGAEVVLERIEATRRTPLLETRSMSDGTFMIPAAWRGQVDWEIGCRMHGYEQLRFRPESATIRVGMIAEHRALLRRLVRWARASGWWRNATRPVPTPLELAARAQRAGRADVQGWADRVNSHVYGGHLPGAGSDEEFSPEPPPLDALR